MKAFLLIILALLTTGCTISARNHHFALEQHSSASYDDFHNIWCYTASEIDTIEVCSGPHRRKSRFIGLGLPIFPQWNRSSPLAYDVKTFRMVQFKNRDASGTVVLSEMGGIQRCALRSSKECDVVESITLEGSSTVWLKIPEGQSHQLMVSSGTKKFKAQLKHFSESRWHVVTV
ncbi:MAG: hypothetical protein KTR32_00910 [Granulosicoccus sp.]|nr:hypothetical protein [Granulosicoccus sp.]